MNTDVRCSRDLEINAAGPILLRDIAKFTKAANRYSSSVILRCGRDCADGKNLIQVSNMRLKGGCRLSITTWGEDAQECLEALAKCAGEWSSKPLMAMAA